MDSGKICQGHIWCSRYAWSKVMDSIHECEEYKPTYQHSVLDKAASLAITEREGKNITYQDFLEEQDIAGKWIDNLVLHRHVCKLINGALICHYDLIYNTKSLKELMIEPDANIIPKKDLVKHTTLNFIACTKVECKTELKQQIKELKRELKNIDSGEK